MSSKTCFKCGEYKLLSEFYAHRGMADGHLNKCKACAKADAKQNRESNLDYYRAYDLTRAKEPKRKRLAARVTAEWRRADKRRSRAHSIVARAIAKGVLERGECEAEGCCRRDTHAHHDDYDKPLQVRWMCPVHHKHEHQF